jgi:hypothetical protein
MSWYSVIHLQLYTTFFVKFSVIIQDAVAIDRGGYGWNCKVMWRAQAAVLIAVADRWEDVRKCRN